KLPAALRARDPDDRGFAVHVRTAHVLEADELERLRLLAVFGHPFAGESPEEEHAGLLRRQLQAELLHPLLQDAIEAFGVALVLKARDEVVGEPDQVRLPLTPRL